MKSIKPTQAYIDQDRAKALLEKWTPVLDYSSDNVSAIEDDHTRLNTAMLLENHYFPEDVLSPSRDDDKEHQHGKKRLCPQTC